MLHHPWLIFPWHQLRNPVRLPSLSRVAIFLKQCHLATKLLVEFLCSTVIQKEIANRERPIGNIYIYIYTYIYIYILILYSHIHINIYICVYINIYFKHISINRNIILINSNSILVSNRALYIDYIALCIILLFLLLS